MSNHDRVILAHGSGGTMSAELIAGFVRAFSNPQLAVTCLGPGSLPEPLPFPLNDQAILPASGKRLAFTTDSYVISPLFFPGGDIGKLAVCGTVNDLAMGGAAPLYMSVSFIIEEGFLISELDRIVASMAKTARGCGVAIVTGDTKVVEKGKGDGIFINTTGIGMVEDGLDLTPLNIREGDKVIVSGTIGDHGTAVLLARSDFDIKAGIESDCAPLHELAADIISAGSGMVRTMRDPTRGGLATILNELIEDSALGMTVREVALPVRDPVRGACELLGFEPVYLANEGKLVVIVAPEAAVDVLE
ncbi:[NiFe] hydrogenase metallocenter assembly protein HypE, partial [hydrothermal vent metagenome]